MSPSLDRVKSRLSAKGKSVYVLLLSQRFPSARANIARKGKHAKTQTFGSLCSSLSGVCGGPRPFPTLPIDRARPRIPVGRHPPGGIPLCAPLGDRSERQSFAYLPVERMRAFHKGQPNSIIELWYVEPRRGVTD